MNAKGSNPVTQHQLNRLVPYTTSEKKWFDYYMHEASGQKNHNFTKKFNQGAVKPMIISEVEAANDQASSEAAQEKVKPGAKGKTVKRKQTSGGKGPQNKKRKKSAPKDIFSK